VDGFYHYEIQWDETLQEHVGRCKEFPVLGYRGKTPEDALQGIKSMIHRLIADLGDTELPEEIPEIPF